VGWKKQRFNRIELFQAEAFQKQPWLVHGFSTRAGLDKWDSSAAVVSNQRAIANALDAAKMPLISLRQVHSDIVQIASAAPPEKISGDAIATPTPGLLLSVQTADCVPILLADKKNRVVAAIHAGWRGTLARIAPKTLGRMRAEFGTRPENVIAAIGPSIGRCCYEVGPEIAQQFAAQFERAADWFDGPFARLAENIEPNPLPWLNMMPPGHQPDPERVNLDLKAGNRWQLEDAGVPRKSISVSSLCTKCRGDLFFSYRREGSGTGRMLAVIGARK
jgi:YfiH family protein